MKRSFQELPSPFHPQENVKYFVTMFQHLGLPQPNIYLGQFSQSVQLGTYEIYTCIFVHSNCTRWEKRTN